MQTVSVSFVGAGYMIEEHIRAFRDSSYVKLGGIYSRTFERAEALSRKYGLSKNCHSVQELFESTQADLVVVAVGELSAIEVAKEVLRFPWLSLFEKPVGLDCGEAELIVALATEGRREAFVALNRRHYSSTRSVLEEIQTVSSRRIVQVFDQEAPKIAYQNGQPKAVVDNWMYANSIHLVDYLSIFCRGDLVECEHIIDWATSENKAVMTKMVYTSGDIGIYQAVWDAPGPWAVSVTTDEVRWEMRPLEIAMRQPYGSRKAEPMTLHQWDEDFKPGLRLQADEAVRAVCGLKHKLPNLKDGLATMEKIRLIYGL